VTFAVRSITRSTTGAEIVHRPQVHESETITVGRGSDCEVRLPDLAVSLRHATLTRNASGTVTVTALGSEPFDVNGQFTAKAELKPSDKPTLTFGSHVLTLGENPDDGSVLVDVNRLEGAPDAAAAENERGIFELAGAGLQKRPVAWAFALIALLVGLVWPIAAYITHANRTIHADKQWSSGPLSKSHAFLNGNCQACHVKAFVSVRDEACLACHQATKTPQDAAAIKARNHDWGGPEKVSLIRDHADHEALMRAAPLPRDPIGAIQAIFRRTFNRPNERCASCHLEHLADTPVKNANGTPGPAQPRETPVLRLTNTCVGCHDRIRERLSGATALRDTPDWRHHPEFRPFTARTPVGSAPARLFRTSLVEHPSDYSGLIFSHKAHLDPSGGVARMAVGLRLSTGALACADCHRPTKDGRGFLPVEMTRDCSSCHSLAYAPGRNLPHGHPDKVIAAMEAGGGGGSHAAERSPPNFLTRLISSITGRADVSPAPTGYRALFAPKGLCAECHVVIAPTNGGLDYKIRAVNQTARYLPWGDFNHSIHAHQRHPNGEPNCAECHTAPDSDRPEELLLPRIAECASCHGRTKDKTPQAASADCAECHSYHAPGVATAKPKAKTNPGAPVDADAKAVAFADLPRRTF